MRLDDAIRRRLFRKWYERELLSSHAHMVLTFLCGVGIFAAIEAFGQTDSTADRLVDVVAILVCTAVALWAMRRYLYLLNHAEFVASQAECPRCHTYARFNLVEPGSGSNEPGPELQPRLLHVACRQCEHRWTIDA